HKNQIHRDSRHLSLRQKLLVLPGITLLGLAALQATNSYVSSAISGQVVFPSIQELPTRDVQVSLKTLVDTEASALGRRVASLNAPEQKVAAIIAETDPLRFLTAVRLLFRLPPGRRMRQHPDQQTRQRQEPDRPFVIPIGVPFVQLNDGTCASGGRALSTTHSSKPARAFNPKSRMSR
ncbi:MAG TPA: hypothetical protein VEV37_10875, partial [Bryobacteraceae bacterium]|nr:hypothetical protein [Bryobacteraceae bacterium]